MKNQLDKFGLIIVTIVIIFCGWGFYSFFLRSWPNIPTLLVTFAFWLVISFMLIALSIGISKGIPRTKIQIPKKQAVVVLFVASLLLLTAGILNGGI